MKTCRCLRACSLASVALLAAGCSPPRGESTGSIENTDTTKAGRSSAQVSITGLPEQADQVAERLMADLNTIQELNGSHRATVVFGDIMNKTGIVPTSDFEAFRTKIRGRLLQSQSLRDKVRFVENRAKIEQLRRRAGGGDLLQQNPGTGVKPLNEEYTYFLNGEMYRVDRDEGQVNLYSMSYNLTGMSSGGIIWTSPSYEIKQVR
jgi:hypothetical protein